jgi:hypothetical protein
MYWDKLAAQVSSTSWHHNTAEISGKNKQQTSGSQFSSTKQQQTLAVEVRSHQQQKLAAD